MPHRAWRTSPLSKRAVDNYLHAARLAVEADKKVGVAKWVSLVPMLCRLASPNVRMQKSESAAW